MDVLTRAIKTSEERTMTKQELADKGLAIDTELCTMCGLCVSVCPTSALNLVQSETDPRILFRDRCNDCGICYKVCAGRDIPLRDLDKFIFGRERDLRTEVLGIKMSCYQANASDAEIRARGASGGVATALLVYALEKKRISAATVVAFDKEQPWKAKPVLATTREEIIDAANSKYVIVPTNAALAEPGARKISGHIGCVGLPCQVHALRKLQYHWPNHRLSKKIAFIIGIHCGGNRSMRDREYLLKEYLGIGSLDDIKSLCYRKGKGGNAYAEVVNANGKVARVQRKIWGTHRTSLAGRCMLCWDYGAELSDVSVGDFFGPAASGSEVQLGASTLVVRTRVGEQLVRQAIDAGYLKVYPTPVEPVSRSSGLIGKKLGRASALMAFKKYGWPCPDYQYEVQPMELPDRVSLASGASVDERERFWARMDIHALS